jgi:adenylate cyclase
VVRLPQGNSSEFIIRDEPLSMGRNPQLNKICISDREVSKAHAVVRRVGGEVLLRDLRSSNHTFVNGREIAPEADVTLADGDTIRLGNTLVQYLAADAQSTVPVAGLAGMGVAPIPLTKAVNPQSSGASKPNLTVVHSFNAPVVASVKQTTERNTKPLDAMQDIEQLRAEYKRLQIAVEFQEKVRLDQGPGALLEQILSFAHTTLKADNGAILRKQPDGTFEASHVKQRVQSAAGFTVSDTLLEQVTTTHSAVLIHDVDFDPRFSAAHSIVSQGIKCAMGVPLITRGMVRGVLYLDALQRTHAFSDKDLHLLTGIANQAAISLENAELVAKVEQEAETRANLSRFLSPALVEQAKNGTIDIKRGGELTEVTILFSDIRGFTSMSERETAQDVVKMLNDYFELMVDTVFKTNGMLDKFIGDALMAIWGAPVKRPNDAAQAVMAALEMQRLVIQFNATRRKAGKSPVYIGIGINTGQAVVGNMGSSKRMEFTAIGDAVNLASRLCHEAKANEIIISEYTRAALPPHMFDLDTSLPPAKVKGKEKPIPIARVIDFASDRTAST